MTIPNIDSRRKHSFSLIRLWDVTMASVAQFIPPRAIPPGSIPPGLIPPGLIPPGLIPPGFVARCFTGPSPSLPSRRFGSASLLCAVVTAFLMLIPVAGSGDTIWIRGNQDPIHGWIESRTDQEIQISVFQSDGRSEKRTIPRSEIELEIVSIEPDRLAQLHPSNPTAYRDCAEELAVQKMDPAARHLAVRLYLLAAASVEVRTEVGAGGDKAASTEGNLALQRSALLGLAAITEDALERRRIRLLLHLIDPSSREFGPLAARELDESIQPTANQQRMLQLVRAIRQEQTEQALQLLRSAENRRVYEGWRAICGLDELDQMARVNRPSQVQLSKLLTIELQVLREEGPSTGGVKPNLSWGDFAGQVSNTLGVLPTFENITQFDPQKSVYRNGSWRVPDSK